MADKLLKSVERIGEEIRIRLPDGVTEFLTVDQFDERADRADEHDHIMEEICNDIRRQYPGLPGGPGGLGDIKDRRYTRQPMGKT